MSNPAEHKLNVIMTISNIESQTISISSLAGPEGFVINNGLDIVEISAYDSNNQTLNIRSEKSPDHNSPDYWQIDMAQQNTCHVKYTIEINKSHRDDFNFFYHGYLNQNFGVFIGSHLFLYPVVDYDEIENIVLKFQLPNTWNLYTPWSNDKTSEILIPSYNMNPYESRVFSWSAIAMGAFEQRTVVSGSSNLINIVYPEWTTTKKETIYSHCERIYTALASIFGDSLDYPYMSVFGPKSDDGTWIYGGTGFLSQVTSSEGILSFNRWIDYAFEIAETRWVAYDHGFTGNVSQWFKAGDSGFIAVKALLDLELLDDQTMLDRLNYWYQYYKGIIESGKDTSVLEQNRSHDLIYSKGPCIGFLLAKEIIYKTNGTITLEDINKYLVEKYWGSGTKLETGELLKEINDYTGKDFSIFFNTYIYGTEILPMEWFFEDMDNDGFSNAFEVLNNSINVPIYLDVYYEDRDNDGYGNPNNSIKSESIPVGYVGNNTDCDDNDSTINPGGTETCGDGIDQDCNGSDSPIKKIFDFPITIDGYSNDWEQHTPTIIDPEGDSKSEAHTDFKKVYLGVDQDFAYIMIETYESPILQEYSYMQINYDIAVSNDNVEHFGISMRADGSIYSFVNKSDNGGDIEDFEITNEIIIFNNNVLEILIPLNNFNNPKKIKIESATSIHDTREGYNYDDIVIDTNDIWKTIDSICDSYPNRMRLWYLDSDKDGYGDPSHSVECESIPAGYVGDNTDCNDNDSSIHTNATEVKGDGIDQDCNGLIDDNTLPSKVTLASPSVMTEDTIQSFKWSSDPLATWYRLLFRDSSEKTVFSQWYEASDICSNENCTVNLEASLESGTYEFWVKSWNEYGNMWSNGMDCTIYGDDNMPASKVTQFSPSGSTQNSAPTFTWNVDPASTWYKLWVGFNSTDKVFAKWYDAIQICSDGTCSINMETALSNGDYEWYVKSWNENGKVWSDGMSFTITE